MNTITPKIIYVYRLTADTGCAPCIFDLERKPTGVLTLACCKGGQIRNKGKADEKGIKTGLRHTIGKEYQEAIKRGEAIIYLLGIYNNTLLYFAQITKIITMAEYFAPNSKYKDRRDCIYEISPNGDFHRNDSNPGFHPKSDREQHRKDWLGEYVLISNLFAYFGNRSKAIPTNLLNILPKAQENKHYDSSSSDGKRILDEVGKHWNFQDIIQNDPHDRLGDCGNRGCGKNENNPVSKGLRHC